MKNKGDKYGVKSLNVGEERYVDGDDSSQFNRYLWTMRQKHPELKLKKFRTWSHSSGIMVRRIE